MLIYKVTNLTSGKVYIGLTSKTVQERWEGHLQDVREGSYYKLHNAVRSYGEKNFKVEVIEDGITDKKVLCEREIFYIAKYRSAEDEFGYNMTFGGDGGRQIDEVIEKIRMFRLSYYAALPPEERKLATVASRKRIQELRAEGKKVGGPVVGCVLGPMSDDRKSNISKAKKGKPGHPNKGRLDQPHSEKSKKLMSDRALARWAKTTPEERRKHMEPTMKVKPVWSDARREAQGERMRLRNFARSKAFKAGVPFPIPLRPTTSPKV